MAAGLPPAAAATTATPPGSLMKAFTSADAPRYKAIGNSMAVPCVAWLGQRLVQCLHKTGSSASD